MKKFLSTIFAIIACFVMGIAVLPAAGCNNFKKMKKAEIDSYLNEKNLSYFSEESISEMQQCASLGKEEIEKEKDTEKIDKIVYKIKASLDNFKPEKSDEIESGRYQIMDVSWYYFMDEDYSAEKEQVMSFIRANVKDDKITIYWYGNRMSCNFLPNGALYEINYLQQTMPLWKIGDRLYLQRHGCTYVYELDRTYTVTERTKTLKTPEDISVLLGKSKDVFWLDWGYQSDYGSVGGAVEIKKAGSDEFVLRSVEWVFVGIISATFELSDFEQGENYVRVYSRGYITFTRLEKEMIEYLDSDYVMYKVTLDNSILEVERVN